MDRLRPYWKKDALINRCMIYTIYKATNKITGKHYIGFDKDWPKRKGQHLSDSFNPACKGYNFKFHTAIREYGPSLFEWEVLFTSHDRIHTLKVMEPHFIREHNSFVDGYNSTKGGQGRSPNAKLSDKGRANLIACNTGKKLSLETRKKLSLAKKGKPNNAWVTLKAQGKTPRDASYIVEYENGEKTKISNLKKFCRDNSISGNAVKRARRGEVPWSKLSPISNIIKL